MSSRHADFRWPLWLSITFAAVAVGFVIATSTRSSLWLDELMSMYYSEPTHADTGELWRLMTTDLHPPGYYVLLYTWREIVGDSVFSARLMSAVFMVALLVVYVRHVFASFGTRIAALSLPVVVVSQPFVVYAQEARSYALIMLLALIGAISCQKGAQASSAEFRYRLIVVVLSCLVMETLHPYAVLWGGAICFVLLVFRSTMAERALIIASGLLLLVYPLARLAWMTDLADDGYNWFAYLNPLSEIALGLTSPILTSHDWWLLLAFPIPIWWLARGQVDIAQARRAMPLLLLLPVVVIGALAIHYFVAPSLSDRNLLVLAPVIWLMVPHALSAIAPTPINNGIVLAWVAALCTNHAVSSTWLIDGFKGEWRDSGRFVDSHYASCMNTPIPVLRYIDDRRDGYFYGYYLQNDFRFEFVERERLTGFLPTAEPSECPIKFWSPHELAPTALASPDELERLGYDVVRFDHMARWSNTPLSGAFVLVQRPRNN